MFVIIVNFVYMTIMISWFKKHYYVHVTLSDNQSAHSGPSLISKMKLFTKINDE